MACVSADPAPPAGYVLAVDVVGHDDGVAVCRVSLIPQDADSRTLWTLARWRPGDEVARAKEVAAAMTRLIVALPSGQTA